MSTSATPGRTWFDPEDGTLPQPGTCYLGLHVPLAHMRRNACTFSDFHTDHQDRARRKLLRMFLRINFCLMADGKLGSGARAYLEWDAKDALSIPTYFRVHVVYQVADTDSAFPERAVEVLGKLIRSDSDNQGKEGVRRNELVVRADSWAALCATYTGQLQVMGPNDLTCAAPCDVFQASRCGDRYMPGMYIPRQQTLQMAASDLNIDIFFEKYCPWYQERQLPEVPLRCPHNPAKAAQLLHLSRTVPEPLKDELLSAWELLKTRAERARGRDSYVQWARAEIAHGLHGPQAGYVPKSESALNMYTAAPFPVAPYPDATLTPFATWVTKFLMECETYTFMYKQHLLLLKLLLGCFDVAREASNGQIHYSAILAGPNSTSKSYVFTLLEDLLIPGTVDRATRRTENSFTYNRDQGCRVLIEHEMSADFFGDSSSRKDSSARTSQTKEILTSHEATTEACQYVDGERVMVETKSRAHLCYLAATNDWSVGQSKSGESSRDSALVSRFDVIFPTRGGSVENKSIMALMAADRDPSQLERDGKAQLVQWVRTMQQVNYWVHRMVHIGALQPINLDAVHAVVDQYSTHGQMAPRVIERIVIMARQCCLQTAAMVHYGYAASPRKGQLPQPAHLHELEPLLVVTAEQAKFALGLYEADLCSSVAEPFALALRKLTFRPDADLGFGYLRVLGCDSIDQLTDEIVMHVPDGHDVSRDLIVAYMDSLRQQTLLCHPYVPRIGTAHGVGPDRDKPRQPAYRMRGVAIHVSMVDAAPARARPLEELVAQRCHVGPPGRELTTQCIPGHAHLLAVRTVLGAMKPYTRAGMYMPPESAAVMGGHSRDTLCPEQRANTDMRVNAPLETKELSRRRAPCMRAFAQQCAHSEQQQRAYPDAYESAYKRARPA
jgi:hypothetical protein